MKIISANLIHSLSRNAGGLYESVRRLVQSLQEEGVGVGVFGCSDEHTREDIDLWKPAEVRVFDPVWPEGFGFSHKYLPSLQEFAPNLVHSHGIWLYPSMVARRYCLQSGTKSIISAHGMLDPWAINNSRWKKAIAYALYEKAHLVNADCLRALCESEADSIRKLGLKNPVAVIPNGIDLPGSIPTGAAPWQGVIEKGRKVLLYLGRLHPKKGLTEMIQAWAALGKEEKKFHQDWALAIAGWDQGGHEDDLKTAATASGLKWLDLRESAEPSESDASLLFLGPQFNEAKKLAYHHCDGFILPSLSEGLPMVVLEAWAWQRPVLMTPECNLPEGFATGAAIQIEARAKEIMDGLRTLLEMTDLERNRTGLNGRSLVEKRFTWPTIAREMRVLYEWMVCDGVAPDHLIT